MFWIARVRTPQLPGTTSTEPPAEGTAHSGGAELPCRTRPALRSDRRPRHGRTRLLTIALGLAATIGTGVSGSVRPPSLALFHHARVAADTAPGQPPAQPRRPDTVVVYGPKRFVAASGREALFVERIPLPAMPPGTRFLVRVEDGSTAAPPRAIGSRQAESPRVEGASVRLDGQTLLAMPAARRDLQRGVLVALPGAAPSQSGRAATSGAGAGRTSEARAIATDSTREVIATPRELLMDVRVTGPAGASLVVSVLALADPAYVVYGPRTVVNLTPNTAAGTTPTTFTVRVAIPATAAPPYTLVVTNGAPAGTSRVTSALVSLDSQPLLDPSDIGPAVARVTKPITLTPGRTQTLEVRLRGPAASFVSLQLTATDTTAPVVALTAPAEGMVTKAATVLVSGTVQDETPASVTVNGVSATMTTTQTGTNFTATVPLPAQGPNTVTVVATDAAGLHTTVTRSVRRDTEAPALTLAAPDAAIVATRVGTATVRGTVADATPVTVTVNGIPLPVDPAGAFSGTVALTEGANFLLVVATDAAGNTTSLTRQLALDTQAPTLTLTAPAAGTSTSTPTVAVTGTVSDATAVTVTVNGSPATVASGAFTATATLVEGTNTLTVVATDAAGNTTTATRSVTRTQQAGNLPPDPATVAPALDRAAGTALGAATAFLYTGPNPIQTGVVPGTITPARAAVVRGRVLTEAGAVLPGVTVRVLGRPEFGQTRTRADGWFDLAVNGGGQLTLTYTQSGYLEAQRQVAVPWQDFALAPTVALVPLDPKVTAVTPATATSIQVATGSVTSDSNGTRQATLLFTPGTQATMVLPDGTTRPLTGTLHVRATEYTVGALGPQRMPGQLPPTSGYTYAVELSIDEAQAASAVDVRFSQPVPFYVENFLGFPVGSPVPVGFYDRQRGQWIASRNGRVIKVLSVTGGMAQLDVTGDNVADQGAALTDIGITDAERQTLGGRYAVGTTLWRVAVDHFTPWDCNWPYGPPRGAGPPTGGPPRKERKDPSDETCPLPGCIIEAQNRVLRERIDVTGTPFTLNYRSDRVPGYGAGRALDIPVSGSTIPTGPGGEAIVTGIEATVTVVGRAFTRTFPVAPNQSFRFVWDGLDAYGRPVTGAQSATVRISYTFPLVYYAARADFAASFSIPGIVLSGVSRRQGGEIPVAVQYQALLFGSADARAQAVGGWSLNVHHAYDSTASTLYIGDGTQRRLAGFIDATITTVAGNGLGGYSGDGGLATQAGFFSPSGVAIGPDGSVYLADWYGNRVRRVGPDGTITTLAGNGEQGFSGDGGPATQARLYGPWGVAVGPDGSVYIADRDNRRVRRVGPDGIITTVAGNFSLGFGDGAPATQNLLNTPTAVAVGPDGSLYIAELLGNRVRRVGPDGIITTFAGNNQAVGGGFGGFSGDGGPATQAFLRGPAGVAVGPDGSVYIADRGNGRVRRVGVDGIIATVAGGGSGGLAGDGGPATQAQLFGPWGVAVGTDGTLYIGEEGSGRVRRVSPDGIITTMAGNNQSTVKGDGVPAAQARLAVLGVAVAPDGIVYATDEGRIRALRPVPGLAAGETYVTSLDGSELYLFNESRRHSRTVDALTRATLYRFAYDAGGRLTSVTDRDGRVTTIERGGDGAPAAIVAASGERTTLTTADGYLTSAVDPAGQRTGMAYNAGGLLTAFTDPRGNTTALTYDAEGRFSTDRDATGATQQVTSVDDATGRTVTHTSAEGRVTRYRSETLPAGGTRLVTTAADGTVTTTVIGTDGTRTITAPDSTVTTTVETGDPRFQLEAPVLTSATVRLPSGLTSTTVAGRQVTLVSATDPLNLATLRDSVVVNGQKSLSIYTAATRVVTSTSPLGRTTTTRVDALGRVVESSPPGFTPVTFAYDARGNVTSSAQGSRTSSYTYDAANRVTRATDALGRNTTFAYDAAGRLTTQTLPDGRAIGFAYDAAGNVTSVTPPERPAHTFAYSPVNLLVGDTPPAVPGAGATAYSYDADRRLTRVTWADAAAVTFAYDAGGRLNGMTTPRGTTTYAHAPISGKLTSISAPGGVTTSYSYDGALPTRETWAGPVSGSVAVTYDNNFRVTGQTVNAGSSVTLGYDADGLLTRAGALTLTRHAQNGLLTGTTLGGVTTSRTYNALGELASEQTTAGATLLLQRTYTRDALGRITALAETVQGASTTYGYGYDATGRLVTVTRDGTAAASHTYDANGNRTSVTTPVGTVAGTYDPQDRLLTYGGASYTYTANGELRTKSVGGQVTQYTYDVLGNLMSVVLPDRRSIEYVVDGANRRVGKRVNGALVQGFLYGGQLAPVAELDAGGAVVSRFVYGTWVNVPDYLVKGGVTYRLLTDQVGSVRLVVDVATGAVAQRLDYDEYGRVTQNTNPGFQPFGYAGGLYDDATGLVRFGARDYDATTGRWTAKDPIGFVGGSTNLYAYVGGNPISHTDPTGLIAPLLVCAYQAGSGYLAGDAIKGAIRDFNKLRDERAAKKPGCDKSDGGERVPNPLADRAGLLADAAAAFNSQLAKLFTAGVGLALGGIPSPCTAIGIGAGLYFGDGSASDGVDNLLKGAAARLGR